MSKTILSDCSTWVEERPLLWLWWLFVLLFCAPARRFNRRLVAAVLADLANKLWLSSARVATGRKEEETDEEDPLPCDTGVRRPGRTAPKKRSPCTAEAAPRRRSRKSRSRQRGTNITPMLRSYPRDNGSIEAAKLSYGRSRERKSTLLDGLLYDAVSFDILTCRKIWWESQ